MTVRLTKGQVDELYTLRVGPQLTYGAGRARVQNGLVRMGLAYFMEISDIRHCVITLNGRSALDERVVHAPTPGAAVGTVTAPLCGVVDATSGNVATGTRWRKAVTCFRCRRIATLMEIEER